MSLSVIIAHENLIEFGTLQTIHSGIARPSVQIELIVFDDLLLLIANNCWLLILVDFSLDAIVFMSVRCQ